MKENAEKSFNEAMDYYHDDHYDKAAEYFREAISAGHLKAKKNMLVMYQLSAFKSGNAAEYIKLASELAYAHQEPVAMVRYGIALFGHAEEEMSIKLPGLIAYANPIEGYRQIEKGVKLAEAESPNVLDVAEYGALANVYQLEMKRASHEGSLLIYDIASKRPNTESELFPEDMAYIEILKRKVYYAKQALLSAREFLAKGMVDSKYVGFCQDVLVVSEGELNSRIKITEAIQMVEDILRKMPNSMFKKAKHMIDNRKTLADKWEFFALFASQLAQTMQS